GREARRGTEVAVAVLVRAAAHRVARRQLCARQAVERGDDGGQRDGDDHGRTRDARRDAKADEDPRAEDRAETEEHRSGQPDDPSESTRSIGARGYVAPAVSGQEAPASFWIATATGDVVATAPVFRAAPGGGTPSSACWLVNSGR